MCTWQECLRLECTSDFSVTRAFFDQKCLAVEHACVQPLCARKTPQMQFNSQFLAEDVSKIPTDAACSLPENTLRVIFVLRGQDLRVHETNGPILTSTHRAPMNFCSLRRAYCPAAAECVFTCSFEPLCTCMSVFRIASKARRFRLVRSLFYIGPSSRRL